MAENKEPAEMPEKNTAEKRSDVPKEAVKKKKKSAQRRLMEHRIKMVAIPVGIVALLATVFFVFFAHYDFSKKAWIVKFDPIHGYTYTMYSKQEYSHARIVIHSCSKKSDEVTVPDTIFGVRVEELEEGAFSDAVKTIHLGKYVHLIGEGYGNKALTLPDGYGTDGNYLSILDKNGTGFYYKAMPDLSLTAFAYFGTEEAYQVPTSFSGIKVSKVTPYYVNDDYLTLLAECEATHSSTLAYNMERVKMIQSRGIDPYIYYLEDLESREKVKQRLLTLPDEYNYLPDGSAADGETAIKLALIHNGDGKGKNCAIVMAGYPPLDFITAERYISKHTSDCHTDGEMGYGEWLMDGFVINT